MTNHDFTTLNPEDGSEMDAYIALPEGQNFYPAIILLQEAFGVNHHIRSIAERLCKEGYVVVAPDLFHRTAKRVEISYTDMGAIQPHFSAISQQGLAADLKASYAWLQLQSNVLHDKIGSIGFCLGGRVSFIANTLLPLSAAVSYYGGGLDALASQAEKMHAPHLFFWGGKDKHITEEKRSTIINAVKDAQKDYINTVISYADHGFNCDERASYNPEAAKEAWAFTLAFFANRLQAGNEEKS
jgi:carboxymethylenebutenolidase